MIEVVNRIMDCERYGGRHRQRRPSRMPHGLDTIALHRFSVVVPAYKYSVTGAPDVAAICTKLAKLPTMPYHFCVWAPHHPGGARVEQGLPLHHRGCHAMSWNDRSIGIAIMCDRDPFVVNAPTATQWGLVCDLVEALWRCSGELTRLDGHVPLNGIDGLVSTGHPEKICPGPRVMDLVPDLRAHLLRVEAGACDAMSAPDELAAYGIVE